MEKIIPPIGLRKRVIELCHEGHFGIVRTKRRVKCSYWWPGIDMEVERIVRECGECADSDKSLKTMRPKLLPMECPVMVWDLLAVDFVGPVQSGNGESKFIIVLIDYFSKWVELEIVEKADADTVVKFLSNVFLREGLPKRLISDNGTHFTASKVETFLKRNGIQHNKTSVYHPSGNGAVERFNRVIKGTIQIACKNRRNWEAEVKKMLWGYRLTPSLTGFSPFALMRGREPFTKDNIGWMDSTRHIEWSPKVVKENIIKAQQMYKNNFDKKNATRVENFKCWGLG